MANYGDPRLPDRFWANVKEDPSGCWLWVGRLTAAGRGRIRFGGRRPLAHRLCYETLVGPVPADRELDHVRCSRQCVRPDHLQPVTHKQNGENRAAANRNSKTGVRGVGFHKGKYTVRVRHDGVLHHGGAYETLDAATDAAKELRSRLFSNSVRDR
jgi:hypothetical protein